jgi:hypothetical protein
MGLLNGKGRHRHRRRRAHGPGDRRRAARCPARHSSRWPPTCGSLTWKWARHSHPNKGPRWVAARYFGKFHPNREDLWVFGDKVTGALLVKHSWTAVRRHIMVKGTASPDDPGLAGYWRYHRDKHGPSLDGHTLTLLARQ